MKISLVKPGQRCQFLKLSLVVIILAGCFPALYSAPAFARQTGMSCSACHTIFPQLNAFGRSFKLNGYTLVTVNTIDDTDATGKQRLKLLSISPFAAMVQASYSNLNKKIPDTQNNNFEFPQQLSMFFSGAITPRIGIFSQFTYEQQSGAFGIDNVDLRYANQTKFASKELIYGFTLNNNPTVQDLWNSTPAWGFPFASSPVALNPAASTLIEGGLSQNVAGLGAYGMFNNLAYAEFSLYRSAPQGAPDPPGADASMVLKGFAPYWRLSFQHQFQAIYLEIGTLGMYSGIYPAGVSGPADYYTDTGFDLQLEHAFQKGGILLHSSWIHESQKLNASVPSGKAGNDRNTLNSYKIDASLFSNKGYSITLGYFMISGSGDAVLYAPESLQGSRTGKPDSNGFILQLDYSPWRNVQFSLQYVANNKFNGAKINYDDSGRNAADNNALYLMTWINF